MNRQIFVACAGMHVGISVAWGQFTNPANGHTYSFTPTAVSWQDAESYAQSVGGHLATIRSQAEQNWITETLSPLIPDRRSLWIGYTDEQTEGDWRWVSGEPTTYTNWLAGEPNNFPGSASGEDFACIYYEVTPSGQWNDYSSPRINGSLHQLFGLIEVVPPPPCRADFNGSGVLSVQDIFDFLVAYFSGEFRADVNSSMSITIQDLFDFLALYFRGCP